MKNINMISRFLGVLLISATAVAAQAQENESNSGVSFSGEIYTEVNYGRKFYGEEKDKWDFPHVVLSAKLEMGKGWSIEGEFEYERFYEDGAWGNDFNANYATNKLFVNKRWNDKFNIKLGIIDVPVGITNAGGPALTIYDPESEAAILPMSWHEGGVSLYGQSGKFDYSVSALAYLTAPMNSSVMVGGSVSAGVNPCDGLRIGASGFWGKSEKGMIGYAGPAHLGCNAVAYAVLDGVYEGNGWTASSSLVYCSDSDSKAFGAECGYDFGQLTDVESLSLIPFVRYDGVWGALDFGMTKLTAGLNFSMIENLVLKIEYGHRHWQGGDTERSLDLGLGYTLAF